MELILAIAVAGPVGFFTRTWQRGLTVYLILWAVVFPVQTFAVHSETGLEPLYWVVNVPILALGVALNLLGSRIRARRRAHESIATEGRPI